MMLPRFVLLWSDVVVIGTVLLLIAYAWRIRGSANLRATWLKVLHDRAAMCSAVVLLLFFAVAVVDSVHFRRALPPTEGVTHQQAQAWSTRTVSLLDVVFQDLVAGREVSYSAPLAVHGH